MIVWLRGNVVVFVGDSPSAFLSYDSYMPSVGNPTVGQVWNGTAFVAPAANSEQANLVTLMAQADNALTTNTQDIADANAWLATNTGTLTTAQLSNAMRSVMASLVRTKQQDNAIIRLLRAKLDATT